MKKRYLVISNWIDKKTGQPKSSAGEINEGVNKEGKNYQITNTESTIMIDSTHPVGTILGGTMTLSPETSDFAQSTRFTSNKPQ